jgi:serine/threonine protein kinase
MSEKLQPENQNNDGAEQKSPRRQSFSKQMWGRTWDKVENWLKKDVDGKDAGFEGENEHLCDQEELEALKKNPSRKALPGLRRPQTFQRQNSERRDRLTPHEPDAEERRALSVDRRAIASYLRSLSPLSRTQPSQSTPNVNNLEGYSEQVIPDTQVTEGELQHGDHLGEHTVENTLERQPSVSINSVSEDHERVLIQAELEAKWILNLSMRFKDRSDREKFFLTYAERPNKWRRLTVSCDYRNSTEDSLEGDLKALHYQRDKSARIYESIRDSLLDIQFYSTVTNLKLKTIDGRLHIHCSEDVNEIVKYPHITLLGHIPYPVYKDSEVVFESHMSGYVYKVTVGGNTFVKKEIPGPDAVDEFIYEANALASLKGSKNVIEFCGLVIDDDEKAIKGLLIKLASRGALVDMIYDARFSHSLPWYRRQHWARQIVNGLAEIHEAGFVQGDFTLSNIVVHDDDTICLIDINRRGCPVGWEPPELEPMIRSGQRISMFIGIKTDLFQLGIVLWAIAMMIDEPEREPKPLREINQPDVPQYYRDIVELCLQSDPRKRISAKDLLARFPSYESPSICLEPVKGETLQGSNHLSEFTSYNAFTDVAASSDYYFDSRDSGIVQDEARDSSPKMKFDDEDIVHTDFKPFAASEEIDSLSAKLADTLVEEPSLIDPALSNTTAESEGGTLTPRPASFQLHPSSLIGVLENGTQQSSLRKVESSKQHEALDTVEISKQEHEVIKPQKDQTDLS